MERVKSEEQERLREGLQEWAGSPVSRARTGSEAGGK